MNEKLPYEHRLADKLDQLPVPDADASWDKMRTKLDRELPPGGGGVDDGRMPDGRWWGFGVTIGVLLVVSWIAYHQGWFGNSINNSTVAVAPQNEHQKADSVSNFDRAGTGAHQPITPKENTSPNANQQQQNDKNLLEANQNNKAETGDQNAGVKSGEAESNASSGNPASAAGKPNANHSAVANPNNVKGKSPGAKNAGGKKPNNNLANAGNTRADYLAASNKGKGNKPSNKNSRYVKPGVQSAPMTDEDDVLNGLAYEEISGLLASHQTGRKKIRARAASIATMPEDQPQQTPKEKSHDDVGFVFGLAFYQNFAISSNLSFGYNSDAKKNIMLDYLPSVYGQYHINPKMYVQAEVQFNMPQATPKLLMYSGYREQMVSGINYGVQRQIYLRKLYYFNIPLSFYYSPAKNFWLGGGFQFSSLNSGLVQVEDHYAPMGSTGDPYSKSIVSKIKKDSLTDKLAKSEFRLMLDVNYNWRWLTAGLRLNQALKDYINLGYYDAQDKNESLQLYLRFNLWDGRQRLKHAQTISQQKP